MPQVARPASDISVGGWSKDTGATTNLFQAIDEASFSDADYVQSDPTSSPDELVIGLGALVDPGLNTGHTINLRQRKDSATGDTTDLDVIVQAGDWDVHTESYDDIDETINAVSITLTSAEVDEFRAHGGYANSRIKLVRRKRATITTTTGVTYTTSPTTLLCDIRRPSSGGPFPVVICVADGFWQNDGMDGVPNTSGAEAIRLAQEEGFATIRLELRTAPANIAPAPMEDCAALLAFLVANAATYNLDATKIAAVGGSGGGHVAMFLGFGTYLTADQFARIKCVVSASAPADLPTMGADSPGSDTAIEDFLGVTEAAGLATWQFFSPTNRVASDTKPTFLTYSTAELIPAVQGNRLAPVLVAQGVESRMVTITGTLHGWALLAADPPRGDWVTWLHRYLG